MTKAELLGMQELAPQVCDCGSKLMIGNRLITAAAIGVVANDWML